MNQITDVNLAEELSEITQLADIVSEQKGDKSTTGEVGSGFAAQYKKLAIVVYD